jgi:hypothetical protein
MGVAKRSLAVCEDAAGGTLDPRGIYPRKHPRCLICIGRTTSHLKRHCSEVFEGIHFHVSDKRLGRVFVLAVEERLSWRLTIRSA